MNLEKEIFDILLQDIIPNRFQPREIFNDNELQELADSIKQHGVIQPIIVRKVGDKYEIIAGERRFRASQLAGKETIPALVRDIDDREAAKIALLENLQRSNLTPIEEAKTYQTILKIDNITQDELAANLGKSQSTIANKLRLLTLDEEVQTALLNSQISERHARSLLGLKSNQQIELLHRIINEKLTVRQLDEEVMKITGAAPNNDMDLQQNNTQVEFANINPQVNNSQVVVTPQAFGADYQNQNIESQTVEQPATPVKINNTTTAPIVDLKTPETVNMPEIPSQTPVIQETVEQPKTENIFDKLRVERENTDQENMFELKNPDLNSVINQQPGIITEQNNDIYDLRFAINNFRQAVQNTEKFGFNVSTTENDLGNKYQLIIEIDKK